MHAPQLQLRKVEILKPVTSFRDLPDLSDLGEAKLIHIRFGPSVFFNSTGIRDWLVWIQNYLSAPDIHIELHECPYVVVQTMNIVADFKPPNAEVFSFYVPFYSETTDETKDVLFKRGQDFVGSKVIIPEVHDSTFKRMSLDVEESLFFRFLRN